MRNAEPSAARLYLAAVVAVFRKDLLLEVRGKETVAAVLAFALLVIVMLDLAIEPTPRRTEFVGPAVLWVAFAFAGAIGLTRSFASERERGSIHALMLAPVGRDAVYFGKALSNFVFLLAVEAVAFPVFGILFDFPMTVPELIPVVVLTTLGFSLTGTVFAAMAVNTRAREVMLPLLFFPVALPVILAALEATGRAVSGVGGGSALAVLPFIAAYDVVFAVVGPFAFSVIVQE